MKTQNFANHIRIVPGFHMVLGALITLGLIASLVNVYMQISSRDNILESVLIALLFVSAALSFYFIRHFSTTVQDRAIRAEEGLRFFILTNKALDSRLTKGQVIALRFAPDDEFLVLADRAVRENMTPREIKMAIKNWRADNDRA